jgi:hypothetical protein
MESNSVEVEIEIITATGSGDRHGIAEGATVEPHPARP